MSSNTAEPSAASFQFDRVLLGMVLLVAFCTLAPLIDVASKMAVQTVSAGTVTLARFVVQALMMLPIVVAGRFPLRLDRRLASLTAARALASIGSTFFFVASVRLMPIADALSITFVSPFMLLLFGRFVLKEHVGPQRLAACVVAFAGTVLVIQPSFMRFGATALLPLGAASCFALYMLVTRYLSRAQHPVSMQLHTALAASLLCLPLLAIGTLAEIEPVRWVTPQGAAWLFCIAMGVAATVSHMAMTYALSFAPSSTLAPLNYLEIVTSTLFGYLFFGDFPAGLTWLGIAVIVASGLFVIHREHRSTRTLGPAEMAETC